MTLPKRARRRATAVAGALAAAAAALSIATPAHADEGADPNLAPAVYGSTRTIDYYYGSREIEYRALPGQTTCTSTGVQFENNDRFGIRSTFTFTGAGTCKVEKFGDTSTYLGRGVIKVHRAPLTVTVDPSSRSTGQVDPGFTTATGWVNGDQPTALAGTPTFAALQYRGAKGVLHPTPIPSTPTSPRGSYVVRVTGYTAPANYRLVYRAGRMTVTTAPSPSVSASAAPDLPGAFWKVTFTFSNLRPDEVLDIFEKRVRSPNDNTSDNRFQVTADSLGTAQNDILVGCSDHDKVTWTTTTASGVQLTATADRGATCEV